MGASPQGRNLIRSLPLPRLPWYVQTKSEWSLGESFATRKKTSLFFVRYSSFVVVRPLLFVLLIMLFGCLLLLVVSRSCQLSRSCGVL